MARFKNRRLRDAYRFPGFIPLAEVQGVFGDPRAIVVKLNRRRKKRCAVDVGVGMAVATTAESSKSGIFRAGIDGCTCKWTFDAWTVGAVEA